jgi:hypothetical protein
MKLIINERQKEILIEALRVYRDELFSIAGNIKNDYLRAGFDKDAENTGDLITKVQNIQEDYRLIDEGIRGILADNSTGFGGGFIGAIKFCRQETGWGLVESKKYVEQIRDAQ